MNPETEILTTHMLYLGMRRAYESFLEIHGKVYEQNFIFPFHTRPFTLRR